MRVAITRSTLLFSDKVIMSHGDSWPDIVERGHENNIDLAMYKLCTFLQH